MALSHLDPLFPPPGPGTSLFLETSPFWFPEFCGCPVRPVSLVPAVGSGKTQATKCTTFGAPEPADALRPLSGQLLGSCCGLPPFKALCPLLATCLTTTVSSSRFGPAATFVPSTECDRILPDQSLRWKQRFPVGIKARDACRWGRWSPTWGTLHTVARVPSRLSPPCTPRSCHLRHPSSYRSENVASPECFGGR